MNENIVLIGVGGIGFRHFQSLLNLSRTIHLVLIDNNEDALKRAQEYRKENAKENITVRFQKNMDILPETLDVLIIATSSLPRRRIFEEITKKCMIKNVIFEKFLFPEKKDYDKVTELLEEKGIKAYVNTPCRLYPGYIKLKKRLRGIKHIDVFVSGSNWGLSCNVIHTVDMVGYLMDSYSELISDSKQLDTKLHNSKRKGYIEFTGRLICQLGDVANIVLDSDNSGENSYKITIYADNIVYTISESQQRMIVSDNGISYEEEFPVFYQSQLTSRLVEDILSTGRCGLTQYEQSVQWHLSLLDSFIKKYNEITGIQHNMCPMT